MPEILSQEEIDALLHNIDQEPAEQQDEPSSAAQDFSAAKKVSLYDFKRPDKVSKEQIRAIKNLHDKFARNFSSKLSAFLRSIIEIDVVSVDQMTYAEFVLSLSSNVSFNVINLSPLEGSGVLSLEPEIGFVLIDRLLGGFGETLNLNRAFTDIEQSILLDVVNQAMKEMNASWEPIINASFNIAGQESSPNVVQIVAPSEIVILVVFEVKLGETSGIINWCLPVIVLESILSRIGTHDVLSRTKRASEDKTKDIIRVLENVPIVMDFRLGDAKLSVEKFLHLKNNDVLILNTGTDDALTCYVNGVKKFLFNMGRKGENKAIKLSNILS